MGGFNSSGLVRQTTQEVPWTKRRGVDWLKRMGCDHDNAEAHSSTGLPIVHIWEALEWAEGIRGSGETNGIRI